MCEQKTHQINLNQKSKRKLGFELNYRQYYQTCTTQSRVSRVTSGRESAHKTSSQNNPNILYTLLNYWIHVTTTASFFCKMFEKNNQSSPECFDKQRGDVVDGSSWYDIVVGNGCLVELARRVSPHDWIDMTEKDHYLANCTLLDIGAELQQIAESVRAPQDIVKWIDRSSFLDQNGIYLLQKTIKFKFK